MTTCTITFSAVDSALQVKPNSTLIFEPSPRVIRGVGAQVMTPDSQRVVSDASGAGTIALVPGTYRLSMDTSGGSRQVDITVPSTPTALLGDLIDTPIGEYEFSALQQLRADVTEAAGQVALDRGAVMSDRTLTETARAAAVAAAPVATGAAAQTLVYRDQAAIYAGSFGPGMILHRPDETIPPGWWDTGLRQSATSVLWGNTATLALISNWSTASLYVGGIATAWFDFSSTAREFQDLAGTAVTKSGQSIGLVRDAISPLTFGPNLVTNGDFTSATAWALQSNWLIANGSASKAVASNSSISQAIALVSGRNYRVEFSATVNAGSLSPSLGSVVGQVVSASGSYVQYITASATSANFVFTASATFTGSIDNITVQEVLGIVAAQPSASLRPQVGAWPLVRRNLVRDSAVATISGSTWGIQGATRSGAGDVLPSGFGSGRIVASGAGAPFIHQSLNLAVGQYTISAKVKGNGQSVGKTCRLWMWQIGTAVFSGTTFQDIILNGSVQTFTFTVNVTTAGTGNVRFDVSWTGLAAGDTADVGDVQVEAGASLTAHQSVSSDLLTITEPGVSSKGFIRFDAVDDTLSWNLPTAVDGELILMGRDGSWREPRLASAGTTVSIGGGAAGTLATPGILRATGPLVAAGFRAGTLTNDEWLRLKRRWRVEGARGELIAGANMIANGRFDTDIAGVGNPAPTRSTLSWVAGELRMDATAGDGGVPAFSFTAPVAAMAPYLVQWTTRTTDGPATTGLVAGVVNRSGGWVTGTTHREVVTFSAASAAGGFQFYGTTGRVVFFDNVSVQPLTPEW